MLTPDTFSALHRLPGDEIFHFYLGDPVEMLLLKPDGTGQAVLLGPDISAGMRLQHTVAGGTWQGSRLIPGGKFALLGTTMSPGFDPADYEVGKRQELSAAYPPYAPLSRPAHPMNTAQLSRRAWNPAPIIATPAPCSGRNQRQRLRLADFEDADLPLLPGVDHQDAVLLRIIA